jgi:hypothetical protein
VRSVVVALAVIASAAVAAVGVQAAVPAYVIQGDRVVGGLVVARATAADARGRFGAPTATRSRGVSCTITWRGLGLTLGLLDFGGRGCVRGVVVTATVTNRPSWRTAVGLRVGDSVARLERLYPRASVHAGAPAGYWLVTRRRCAEAGGGAFPGLLARMRARRVAVLVMTAGVCE